MKYRTCAINNRGLNSEKTFLVIVRGYYSREVTIQEKLFSTSLFHRNFYKNSLDYQDLDSPNLDPHQFRQVPSTYLTV